MSSSSAESASCYIIDHLSFGAWPNSLNSGTCYDIYNYVRIASSLDYVGQKRYCGQ